VKRRGKYTKGPKVRKGVYISTELAKQFELLANDHGFTFSSGVVELIKEEVEKNKEKEKGVSNGIC